MTLRIIVLHKTRLSLSFPLDYLTIHLRKWIWTFVLNFWNAISTHNLALRNTSIILNATLTYHLITCLPQVVGLIQPITIYYFATTCCHNFCQLHLLFHYHFVNILLLFYKLSFHYITNGFTILLRISLLIPYKLIIRLTINF